MEKYNINMLAVRPEITEHGFSDAGPEWGMVDGKKVAQWYKIVIPQTFRGKYTLYLCEGDICGVFQDMAIQDHDFGSLMDKLSFRSPEWVDWTKNMLDDLKSKEIIDFEVEAWPIKENAAQ